MMANMARTPWRGIAVMSLGLLVGLAHAQEVDTYETDPPERAARLGYIQGDVSLQPAGEEAWAPALLNRPLTSGDTLWTEQGARAEITVGQTDVRLDSNTGFSFLEVGNDVVRMRITTGVMNVSVRSLADREQIEIETPDVTVALQRSGSYRIETDDAGDTVVKVSEGVAEVTGPAQNVVVRAQEVVRFSGADERVARFSALGPPDEFDSWNLDRDRRADRAATSRTAEYVSPDVTGYEDLDDNGSWSSEPEYGYVWTPTRVAVGWSPYRYGRWVSVAPWGWTWIDDAPWGFAPFHYCRWVPGPRHARPVYAPALVGWVGSPGRHVSWFPLGPREVYVPGRRHSRHYYERVNTANTVVVRNALDRVLNNRGENFNYRNRGAPGGVTTVPRTTFTSAGRIGEHRAQRDGQLNNDPSALAPATAVAPRITPVRESRLGGAARPIPPSARIPTRPDRRRDSPQVVSPVSDPRGIAARVREDSERQVRAEQWRREGEQRRREGEQQRSDGASQRWQRQDEQPRQQREQAQALREQQMRERAQRPPEEQRQLPRYEQPRERPVARERYNERPQMERPRIEQPRVEQPRVDRPRVEQPRAERPRVEQPRTERPSRSEVRTPPAPRADQPNRRQEHQSRRRE